MSEVIERVSGEVAPSHFTSLEDLAAAINRLHGLAASRAAEALANALECGECLLEAQRRVPCGEWHRWLEGNFDATPATGYRYMRLAQFREVVSEAPSMHMAVKMLQAHTPDRRAHRLELRAKSCEMREKGLQVKEIAEMLGVNADTVSAWTNPKVAKSQRERDRKRSLLRYHARQAQLREEQRLKVKKIVRKQGEAVNELYLMVERMQDVFAQADDELNGEARRLLLLAGETSRKMRDQVVRAMLAAA